jgi:hypothetical protein
MYQQIAAAAGYGLEFGEKTCFDHTRDTVIIGVAQLKTIGVTTPALIDYVVLHEIGHFCEYHQDPEGYLKINAEAKRRADIGTPAEGKLYFQLYNCLQDIYVNQNTADRAPQYRNNEHRDGAKFSAEIVDLYRNGAFKERDFSDRPRCMQFAHYLLNLGMGVADDIKLAPEVRAVIDSGVTLFGQRLSFQELIDTYLLPAVGERSPKGWSASMTQRGAVIEHAVVPIFDKLLALDKQQGRNLEVPDMNPLAAIEPDADAIEAAAKSAKQKIAEKNLTPAERNERERGKQANAIAEAAGLTPEQGAEFAAALQRMQPVIHELVAEFMELRHPVSTWRTVLEGPFRRGSELSISAAIEHFDQVQERPGEAPIFLRTTPVEEVQYLPRKVRLWVVPDLSGSMKENLEALRDVTVALAASMVTLSQQAEYTNTEMSGELGVIGFHEHAVPLIEPAPGIALQSVAAAFPKITADGNDTCDHTALEEVLLRVKRLQGADPAGETLDILVEITDGETRDAARSRELLRSMQALGMIVGAIYIGGSSGVDTPPVSSPEADQHAQAAPPKTGRNRFDQVWNSTGERRGRYILHPSQLGTAVRQLLGSASEEFSRREIFTEEGQP